MLTSHSGVATAPESAVLAAARQLQRAPAHPDCLHAAATSVYPDLD